MPGQVNNFGAASADVRERPRTVPEGRGANSQSGGRGFDPPAVHQLARSRVPRGKPGVSSRRGCCTGAKAPSVQIQPPGHTDLLVAFRRPRTMHASSRTSKPSVRPAPSSQTARQSGAYPCSGPILSGPLPRLAPLYWNLYNLAVWTSRFSGLGPRSRVLGRFRRTPDASPDSSFGGSSKDFSRRIGSRSAAWALASKRFASTRNKSIACSTSPGSRKASTCCTHSRSARARLPTGRLKSRALGWATCKRRGGGNDDAETQG